jgi:hypothetical protein
MRNTLIYSWRCPLCISNPFLCSCFISWNSEDRPLLENHSLFEYYFEIWLHYNPCSCRTYYQFNSSVNKLLTKCDINLLEAATETKIVIRRFNHERNDVHAWGVVLYEIASEFEIEASRLRVVWSHRNRVNHHVDKPSDYWRISLYLSSWKKYQSE